MRVFCEHQESHPDTYCHHCGEGFTLYWEGQPPREKAEALAEVEQAMLRHHMLFGNRNAHPEHGFVVQRQSCKPASDRRAMLGSSSLCAA